MLREALDKLSATRERMELEHELLPGQKLWLQQINGAERDEWESLVDKYSTKDGKCSDFGSVRAKLIQLALVDESGKQVYSAGELAEVNKLPGTLREDLFQEASEFNGLSREAEGATLKNSVSESGNGSDTASPTSSEPPTCGNYLNP